MEDEHNLDIGEEDLENLREYVSQGTDLQTLLSPLPLSLSSPVSVHLSPLQIS